jgi:NADPH-dependent curcumin reductase CurA
MTTNRQWLLAARPIGRPIQEADFRLAEAPRPSPGDGEILVRTLYLGCDPSQKGWMENASNYEAPIAIGDVMRSRTVGRVVESRASEFATGDLVQGFWGWSDYACVRGIADPVKLEKLSPDHPPSEALSGLGSTSLTAYFGMLKIGKPREGDTVVVSGAAGATGSIAGQIAKIHGCRVIGIAGSREKCAWLTGELGFDAAIDYANEDVAERLGQLCPNGIDIFYDNVGGAILDAALARLAMNARVVLCGGISRYETDRAVAGPANYFNLVLMRARMEGFIVRDYATQFTRARVRLQQWLRSGELKYREDIVAGLENAPRALLRVFRGENVGKQLVKVAD